MSSEISRAVRVEIETRLVDNFNGLLGSACEAFGIPDQAFIINWTPGVNYFRAPYTLSQLRETVILEKNESLGSNWPCITMATRTATDDHQRFGSTKFAGPVQIEIGVYLVFEGRAPADMESLPDAVESALVDSLNVAPFVGVVSPPVQGTWASEKGDPEFYSDRWFVPITFRSEFEVTA